MPCDYVTFIYSHNNMCSWTIIRILQIGGKRKMNTCEIKGELRKEFEGKEIGLNKHDNVVGQLFPLVFNICNLILVFFFFSPELSDYSYLFVFRSRKMNLCIVLGRI